MNIDSIIINSKGTADTMISTNGVKKKSKINWDGNMEKGAGQIHFNVSSNGKKLDKTFKFSKEDLAKLLNTSAEHKDIFSRLTDDYPIHSIMQGPTSSIMTMSNASPLMQMQMEPMQMEMEPMQMEVIQVMSPREMSKSKLSKSSKSGSKSSKSSKSGSRSRSSRNSFMNSPVMSSPMVTLGEFPMIELEDDGNLQNEELSNLSLLPLKSTLLPVKTRKHKKNRNHVKSKKGRNGKNGTNGRNGRNGTKGRNRNGKNGYKKGKAKITRKQKR